MRRTLLEDAFAHHVWETLRLIDACLALSPEQLDTVVPGTYGSILETVRLVVGSDSWDLFVASDERTSHIEEERMDLAELRAAMEGHGAAWLSLLELRHRERPRRRSHRILTSPTTDAS